MGVCVCVCVEIYSDSVGHKALRYITLGGDFFKKYIIMTRKLLHGFARAGWLNQQECIFSCFRRLEIWGQSAERVGFFWDLSPWFIDGHLLMSSLSLSSVCICVLISSSYGDISHIGLGQPVHACTHSSVPAWIIPETGEPGGLLSMGSHRVGHDWSDLAAAAVQAC